MELSVLLMSLALGVWLVHANGFRFQHTGSLPRGIYRTVQGEPVRGAIGMWCLPPRVATWARGREYLLQGSCPGGAEPIGKVVLGVSGDTIGLTAAGLTVNRQPVPNSQPRLYDSRGRPLAPVSYGIYVLQEGEVWLGSPYTPLSFDSRYFGPVPQSDLVSLVIPVWTNPSVRPVRVP
jgi:conjugative transfer signal peptidase TraF